MFLSGAAEITVPGSSQHAFVTSFLNGLLLAADTAAVSKTGHVSAFTELTILLQIPTAGGVIPARRVLHSGACRGEDLVGGGLDLGVGRAIISGRLDRQQHCSHRIRDYTFDGKIGSYYSRLLCFYITSTPFISKTTCLVLRPTLPLMPMLGLPSPNRPVCHCWLLFLHSLLCMLAILTDHRLPSRISQRAYTASLGTTHPIRNHNNRSMSRVRVLHSGR